MLAKHRHSEILSLSLSLCPSSQARLMKERIELISLVTRELLAHLTIH